MTGFRGRVLIRYDDAGEIDTMTLADAHRTNRKARLGVRLLVEIPLTRNEIRAALSVYVIHPDLFDGDGFDLAAEYIERILHIDPATAGWLCAVYADVAASVLR